MAKFDTDFAIFGAFAADLLEGITIENTVIDYVNQVCIELYGDLRGKTILEIISDICTSAENHQALLNRLNSEGMLEFDGKLAGKYVQYHSRIVDCRDDDSCSINRFIQGAITDITESVILKELLYGTSEALKRAAEAADEDTGKHLARIDRYAGLLATLIKCEKKFVEDISQFAQLHDIGKIKVADIVRLPRKLTDDEFNIIKKHTIYGGEIVVGLAGLEMAYNIVLEHHEKWDGSGYPHGKENDEISLEARIVAIVDAFDALVSARPYKEAIGYNRVFQIFKKGDGRVMPSHFDPELLPVFLEHYDEFIELHKELKD